MKTTVEIDQQKLKRVMQLTGLKTQRQAIDFALDHAAKIAQIMKVLEGDFYVDQHTDVIDPKYDLNKLRKRKIKRV